MWEALGWAIECFVFYLLELVLRPAEQDTRWSEVKLRQSRRREARARAKGRKRGN